MKTFNEIKTLAKKQNIEVLGIYIDVNNANKFYAKLICKDDKEVYFNNFTKPYKSLAILKTQLTAQGITEQDIYDKYTALSLQ